MVSRSVVIKLGTSTLTAGTDALNLPFRDSTFDAVVSGYLMRNALDVARAWAEQYCVLKPGGRAVGFSGVQHHTGYRRHHTGYCRHHTGYCRHHRLMFGTVAIHWGWK
ncbi:MAG: class I SAM-dependent methyltransferase [Anaerolineaceae bacterium]|nr:class I SAM-dependent methyltransferase [Anaerolineaceae bacterium]